MYKHNQNGFAHFLILIFVIVVIAFIVLAGLYVGAKQEKGDKGNNTPNSNNAQASSELKLKYDIYPKTSDAPVLHLYWGPQKSTVIDSKSLIEIEKFGVFEDVPIPNCESTKDPGAEWAIHFKPGSIPVHTYASGTITNIQDEGASKEVVIRYGSKYAVKYLHVTNVPSSLKTGDKIEAGTLVGYTQLIDGNPKYEFWELEIDKILDGNIARTDFPLNYFDAESRASFESLRASSGLSSWFVDESSKSAGWLAYVGKPEAWADMSKLGTNSNGDDYCQFLRSYKLIGN